MEYKCKITISNEDYKLILKKNENQISSTIQCIRDCFNYYTFNKDDDKTKLYERLFASLEKKDGFDYDITFDDDMNIVFNITNSYLVANETITYKYIKHSVKDINEQLIIKLTQRLRAYDNPVYERIYFEKNDSSVPFYDNIVKYLVDTKKTYNNFVMDVKNNKINFDDVKVEFDAKSSFDMIKMFIINNVKNTLKSCSVNGIIKLLLDIKQFNCVHYAWKGTCDNCNIMIKSILSHKCYQLYYTSKYNERSPPCISYSFWRLYSSKYNNEMKYEKHTGLCHGLKDSVATLLIDITYYELVFNMLSFNGSHPYDLTRYFCSNFIKCIYDESIKYHYTFIATYQINNEYYDIRTLESINVTKNKPFFVPNINFEMTNITYVVDVQYKPMYIQVLVYRDEC
jgi:hypothetical protein